jgi:exodeoxyribonuclease VII large subunit
MESPIIMEPATILTVAQVSRQVKDLLEESFSRLSVEGEVTGYKKAVSGHHYFSLSERDLSGTTMKLDCVVYRFARAAARLVLRDGQKVIVTGRITAWGGASKYQFVAEQVEEAGHGDLLRRLEELKQRLAAEGLFDTDRKRPLPFLPRRIGVVTSLRGAALRDIVRTILSRYPARILVVDSLVQGDGAAEGVESGIALLNRIEDVDVLIVGRGGGSLEDLWAFNQEIVVRAVAGSGKPIVSAVGHEVDHVLSDAAADVRAATPTAAGQAVVPSMAELRALHDDMLQRLAAALKRRLETAGQRLDEVEARLQGAATRAMREPRHRLDVLGARLLARHPARLLAEERRRHGVLGDRLRTAGTRLNERPRNTLESLRLRLEPCDPFRPLERGYALARTPDGRLVNRHDQVAPGDALDVLLGTGAVACEVRETRIDRTPPAPPSE